MNAYSAYFALFAQLNTEAVLLTPNRRLARFVTSAQDAWQQQQQRAAWQTLKTLAWDDWILERWQWVQSDVLLSEAQRLVLKPSQSAQLWQEIVQALDGGYSLLQPDALATQAAQAWSYLQNWGIRRDAVPCDLPETELWHSWAQAYEQRLEKEGWLDSEQLPTLLLQVIHQGGLSLPSTIILVGFDELTPLQTALLDALRMRGLDVKMPSIALPSQVSRIALPSCGDEIPRAAAWAAECLRSLATDTPPRIGIVIPDLPKRRLEVEREFSQCFHPEQWLLSRSRHAPGYNLSVAQPLGQTPLIAAALDLLHLSPQKQSIEFWQRLLYSPFWGLETELGLRAHLASCLAAKSLQPKMRDAQKILDTLAVNDNSVAQSDLAGRLLQWREDWRQQPKTRQSMSTWVALFTAQLNVLGWPGQRRLDSLEYQQLALWPGILDQARALDWVLGPQTRQQALQHLSQLTYTPFAAQTQNSPVQVLGLLEAAGQHFDYLWVMQMESRTWPAAPAPNPLLPIAWQRQQAMPRSSAEKELALAQRLTQRLVSSARVVILSYGAREDDLPLQASPLITAFPLQTIDAIHSDVPLPSYATLIGQTPVLESWTDDHAAALDLEQPKLRGGSQILKDQAACGFRAFATHRLDAKVIPPVRWGVSGALRGNLLHQALDLLWRRLGDQARLLALPEADLQDLLAEVITEAWHHADSEHLIGTRLRAIESERMQSVLWAWLDLEKQRPPFAVELQESRVEFPVGPLRLTLRYDRVDALEDGGRLVLDYKTGEVNIHSWLGERPDDPQVPLYCLSQPNSLAAAFGQLRAEQCQLMGISSVPLLDLPSLEQFDDPAIPENWSELLVAWRLNLTALAEEFAAGYAVTNPKYGEKTCQYCQQKPFCRIYARSQSVPTNSLEGVITAEE